MSKHFAAIAFTLPLILQIFSICSGQSIDAVITIRDFSSHTAEIKGKFTSPRTGPNTRSLSIIRDFAGFSGLAERVSDVRLEDATGKAVAFRQLVPGEYVAAAEFQAWSYQMDLSPRRNPAATGHTSWIGTDNGLLFLRDIFPTVKDQTVGDIEIVLPAGWSSSKGSGRFSTRDIDETAILIGRDRRERTIDTGDLRIRLFISGSWKFEDDQAVEFASQIYREYRKLFGSVRAETAAIFLIRFPQTVDLGTWEADTRGETVTILSADMPFQIQSVQRLHEQLRHEIFHLWFPNAVSLKGNYDWFYEGFALYQSLRTGVALNRLRFDDYLDTLGRALTIDSMLTDRRSLTDATGSRGGLPDTALYARGMLAAFLTDIETLRQSKGRADISSVLRSIFDRYRRPAEPADGNEAVLNLINKPIVSEFVRGEKQIDWTAELGPAGIEAVKENNSTTLKVIFKPTSSQKKLLDKLGYNNWRKLAPSPR